MKTITTGYKNALLTNGRILDAKIIYGNDEITSSDINQLVPSFNGDLLKSVMKGVEIDCNVSIPTNEIINVQFGLLVNNSFEYIDYGNYLVKSCDYNADTKSYKIITYDKLILSMINVEDSFIQSLSYPILLGDYLEAICTHLGLILKNKNFINADKYIKQDIHSGIGYKYRDIFDEISQVTGGNICIDSNDEVEVRYFTETNEVIDEHWLKDTNVTIGEKYGPVNAIVFSRAADSDTINRTNDESIAENGICEIKIIDNQILSTNDRDDFIQDLFEYLDGFEFFLCDYETFGITYLEFGDKYSISINNIQYPTIMLNNETNIGQGLGDKIYCKRPGVTETNYKASSKTDKMISQAYILVNKQEKRIDELVSEVQENSSNIASLTITSDSISQEVASQTTSINELGQTISQINSVIQEQTDNAITTWFNQSGIQGTLDQLQQAIDSNDEDIETIKSYYKVALDDDQSSSHYGETYVELGAENNQTKIRIYPNVIQFLTNGEQTAYISNNSLYISESTILTKQQIGHWVTTEDEVGNLNTYWVEGV